MAGLVPAIHVLLSSSEVRPSKKVVDARHKAGHDGVSLSAIARCPAQRHHGRIEADRRGIRDIQALDRAWQLQPGADVADFARRLAQAAALGAEHQRERLAQFGGAKIALRLAVEPDGEETE